jgi:hypothetical protein
VDVLDLAGEMLHCLEIWLSFLYCLLASLPLLGEPVHCNDNVKAVKTLEITVSGTILNDRI